MKMASFKEGGEGFGIAIGHGPGEGDLGLLHLLLKPGRGLCGGDRQSQGAENPSRHERIVLLRIRFYQGLQAARAPSH